MTITTPKDVEFSSRREQVAELFARCVPQTQIAKQLGISQPTVSRDIKAIRAQWRESAIFNYNTAIGRELFTLNAIEREAWEAWERSKKPSQSVTQNGNGATAGDTTKTMHTRDGDPRYMEVIHKCSASRRQLLGLDAAPVVKEGGDTNVNVTIDLRQSRIAALIAAANDRNGIDSTGARPVVIDAGVLCKSDQPGEVAESEAPGLPGPSDL